jgi:hypothetical protein
VHSTFVITSSSPSATTASLFARMSIQVTPIAIAPPIGAQYHGPTTATGTDQASAPATMITFRIRDAVTNVDDWRSSGHEP